MSEPEHISAIIGRATERPSERSYETLATDVLFPGGASVTDVSRKRKVLFVSVDHDENPIDLKAWADLYVRAVLNLEGVEVLPRVQSERPPFRQAG